MTPAVICMTTDEAQTWVARGHCLATDLADWYREGEEREAWRALGYGSIRECVATELRLEGRSYREIGELMGVSKDTVAREIATVSHETVALPERITGLDGKSRPAVRSNLTEAVKRHLSEGSPTAPEPYSAEADINHDIQRGLNRLQLGMDDLFGFSPQTVVEFLPPEQRATAATMFASWANWLKHMLAELEG